MQVPGPAQIARRSDMDMNGHINNVVYLAWALESVPEAVYDGGYNLFEMEVDFKAECKAGDTVQSSVQRVEGGGFATSGLAGSNGGGAGVPSGGSWVYFLHTLARCDESGCTELVRARTSWHKAA